MLGPIVGCLDHSKIDDIMSLPQQNFGILETIREVSFDLGIDDSKFARSVPEGMLGENGSTSGGLGLMAEEGNLRCSTIGEVMPVRKVSLHTHTDCA